MKSYNSCSFLYITGISLPRILKLTESISLIPVNSSIDESLLLTTSKSKIHYGLALITLANVTAQLLVNDQDPKSCVIDCWNSQWYLMLISAIFDCELAWNFQGDTSFDCINDCSQIDIVHPYIGKTPHRKTRTLLESDLVWIETNLSTMWSLLDLETFSNAIHALVWYRAIFNASGQMAIIWSAIEGLFHIESELSFRLSLYISLFLEDSNRVSRKSLFDNVKTLYNHRSSAVHGKSKKVSAIHVQESCSLLRRLVIKSIELGELPCTEDLIP